MRDDIDINDVDETEEELPPGMHIIGEGDEDLEDEGVSKKSDGDDDEEPVDGLAALEDAENEIDEPPLDLGIEEEEI
jgi:hypothetical protein